MSTENTSADALDQTLNQLLNVAEATDLAKGGVENSGTHGSGGKQGGGQGSEGDAGPIDNMMIAKMIQAGVDVQTAAKFAAFMSEDEDDDEVEKSGAGAEGAEPLTKSLREAVTENLAPEDAEMVNVTPYLDSLTTALGGQLETLDKSIRAGRTEQGKLNKSMAKALHQVGQLVKSQAAVINVLGERLGIVERAPAVAPKGVTGTAKPLNKSLAGEAGEGDLKLTKSTTLNALSYFNLVKGEKQIAGQSTSDVITKLEAGGVYDEKTHGALIHLVKSLPAQEREKALSGNF